MCVCLCVFACVLLCICVCVRVCVCASVFVGAVSHRVSRIIFLLSVSVRNPFSKNGSHNCFLEINNFR
jgi:hypothetical protein